MSLLNAAERFASIDRSQVILDVKRCLHSQDQFSDCAACFSICPVQAITGGKPPTLDAEHCESCLACLSICPIGAYLADDDVADLLNCATHIEDQAVELLCGLHSHPESSINAESIGIQIQGCLAGLGTGALLNLSVLGLSRITLRTDGCSACKWHSLHSEIHLQAEKTNRFLCAWDRGGVVSCLDEIETSVERPLWSVKNPPLSRRDLFRMMARQGQVVIARAMENGVASSKRQPGRDRLRIKSAVSYLPEHGSGTTINLDGFASLIISESCSACGVCGKACPTEALRFEKNEDETSFILSFYPQDCIGCDLCVHVCAPAAITLNHAPVFDQVFGGTESMVLASGELVRCERCGTLIAARAGIKLCALCEYRRRHPFGSKLPPGMNRPLPDISKEPRA